jgi:hypothetical protein
MRTSRLRRRRGINVHQEAEEEMDRYAQASQGREGWICTCMIRGRGTDVHQQQGREGWICTSRLRKREMDLHQQVKVRRGGDSCFSWSSSVIMSRLTHNMPFWFQLKTG